MTLFGAIDGIAKSLDFHMERQNLISGNLANVDTPGYAPKELKRPYHEFSNQFALHMTRTDQAHFDPAAEDPLTDYRVEETRDHVPGNDKNYVSLDREMAKLSANTIRFETISKLVSKQLGLLNYAAQDRR